MFKRAAKDMKLMTAAYFGVIAGGITLVSTAIANRISNK